MQSLTELLKVKNESITTEIIKLYQKSMYPCFKGIYEKAALIC
jgi:hypothetical protein